MLQREIRHGIYRGCLKQVGLEQPTQVFRDDVGLYVDPASRPKITQRRVTQSVIDQRKLQTARLELIHREANAVNRDRPVKNEERLDGRREGENDKHSVAGEVARGNDAYTVHVPLDDMPTETVGRAKRPLEIHARSCFPSSDRRPL